MAPFLRLGTAYVGREQQHLQVTAQKQNLVCLNCRQHGQVQGTLTRQSAVQGTVMDLVYAVSTRETSDKAEAREEGPPADKNIVLEVAACVQRVIQQQHGALIG